jgi:hypothetical protein
MFTVKVSMDEYWLELNAAKKGSMHKTIILQRTGCRTLLTWGDASHGGWADDENPLVVGLLQQHTRLLLGHPLRNQRNLAH